MSQIIRLPDGRKVAFPDDMPKEEIRALIEEKFPQEVAQHNKAKSQMVGNAESMVRQAQMQAIPIFGPIAAMAEGYSHEGKDSMAGQALSGVNEGVSAAASMPASLAHSVLSIGPTIANSTMGTDFSTDTSYIPDPGAEAKKLMTTVGAIAPPSTDPAKKFARRVGQDIGAIVPFGGIEAMPSALGAGVGAASGQMVAPDNPWVELGGEIVGGMAPAVLGKVVERLAASKAGPTVEELQAMKSAAYKAADDLGARYTPQSYDRLINNIDDAVANANISPTTHPDSYDFVRRLQSRTGNASPLGTPGAIRNQGLSLTELDQIRQEVYRDLIKNPKESEQAFGRIILGQIDDFIAGATAKDMAAGSAADASQAITVARELNKRFRKTELIADAIDRAQRAAAASGSGGNINNAIRQQFNRILNDKMDLKSFTAEEIAVMRKIVQPGKGDDILRLIGKLSPSGNGLMAALGIGATAANPLMATVPAVGMAAKAVSDTGTVNRAAALQAQVARGGAALTSAAPSLAETGAALGAGIIANDNAKRAAALRASGQ